MNKDVKQWNATKKSNNRMPYKTPAGLASTLYRIFIFLALSRSLVFFLVASLEGAGGYW